MITEFISNDLFFKWFAVTRALRSLRRWLDLDERPLWLLLGVWMVNSLANLATLETKAPLGVIWAVAWPIRQELWAMGMSAVKGCFSVAALLFPEFFRVVAITYAWFFVAPCFEDDFREAAWTVVLGWCLLGSIASFFRVCFQREPAPARNLHMT